MGEFFSALPAEGAFVCRIPRLPLPASIFRSNFNISTEYRRGDQIDFMTNAMEWHVENGHSFGGGEMPGAVAGVALVPASWRVEPAPALLAADAPLCS